MSRMNLFLSISFFAVFAGSLLVINQFEMYEPSLPISVEVAEGEVLEDRAGSVSPISAHPKRGSVISTGENARLMIQIGNVIFGLDEHTSLRLDRLTENRIEVFLPTGRIIVDAKAGGEQKVSVYTSSTETTVIRAMTSIVHFAADKRTHVIPMESVAGIIVNNSVAQIIKTPLEIQEVAPFTITDITFDPEKSSASAFYSWFTTQRPDEVLE